MLKADICELQISKQNSHTSNNETMTREVQRDISE